jgi:hypothetical protein
MAMTRAERSKINKANWAKKSRSQGRGSSSSATVRLPSGRKTTLPSGLKQWFCADVMQEGDECFACFRTPAEAIKHGDRVVFTEWSETNPAPLSHCGPRSRARLPYGGQGW